MSLRRLSSLTPPQGAYTPIGARQHRVMFFTPGDRASSSGKALPPTEWGERWAAIRSLQGTEIDKAQQIAQTISQLVTIAFEEGIEENMTLQTSDGRTLQIRAIDDADNRGVELRLYCSEVGQNAGQQG